jgi:hypothetical protein
MVLTSLRNPRSGAEDEEKYPALRIVLMIWKVLVVIQVLGVVVFTIGSWATVKDPNKTAIGLLLILGSFLVALIQWASAEFVQVVMDIEENTRRTAEKA